MCLSLKSVNVPSNQQVWRPSSAQWAAGSRWRGAARQSSFLWSQGRGWTASASCQGQSQTPEVGQVNMPQTTSNTDLAPRPVHSGPGRSYTTSRERHSILIQLIGVQHAQLDRQLPLIIGNDGVGQRTFRFSVQRHHILEREGAHSHLGYDGLLDSHDDEILDRKLQLCGEK